MILQVNINRIKNKLDELKRHADIIPIRETKLTPKSKPPNVHTFTTVCTDRSHKAGVGSSPSSEITLHSLQHTYPRPFIHTTQNFKWSTTLNTSQLQTSIYLLGTAHPHTTKQLTWTT